jgi:hypothetical protein
MGAADALASMLGGGLSLGDSLAHAGSCAGRAQQLRRHAEEVSAKAASVRRLLAIAATLPDGGQKVWLLARRAMAAPACHHRRHGNCS